MKDRIATVYLIGIGIGADTKVRKMKFTFSTVRQLKMEITRHLKANRKNETLSLSVYEYDKKGHRTKHIANGWYSIHETHRWF